MATQPTSDGTETLFKVQVGAYFKVAQAAACLRKLMDKGYKGIVIKGKDNLYRVQVGAFNDIVEAQDFEEKIRALRFKSFITICESEQVPAEEVEAVMPPPVVDPKKLDKVRIEEGAPRYGTNVQFPDWVYNVDLYIRYIDGDCVTISTVATGPVLGNVHKKYIVKYMSAT